MVQYLHLGTCIGTILGFNHSTENRNSDQTIHFFLQSPLSDYTNVVGDVRGCCLQSLPCLSPRGTVKQGIQLLIVLIPTF